MNAVSLADRQITYITTDYDEFKTYSYACGSGPALLVPMFQRF